ncbi:MAG: motility associated factor glycosyltransferase family protein [Nitrospinae bacterium]|nr:motility associated factor glycosyltransferase family protein [Nitrospinota bacterium]
MPVEPRLCYIRQMSRDEQIREVKSATFLRFNQIWQQNFQTNKSAIQKNPGVIALKNKFRDLPSIVVGAGPSLDKNIRFLHRAQNKAVIISCDAALKPLMSHGITPDFVVCLDPQEEISRFLMNVPHKGITLVVPSIVHPHILELWESDILFFNKFAPDIPTLVEIQKAVPHIGILTPGGTVLSVTYDLAFQAGSAPIIFVGQDLSYPKKNSHSQGSDASGQGLKLMMEKQKDNLVLETDINGKSLRTLKSMSVSKEWFNWAFTTWKRDNPLKLSNCSEAGILTDNCTVEPLTEAIIKHCTKKINIPWILKKALKRKNRNQA